MNRPKCLKILKASCKIHGLENFNNASIQGSNYYNFTFIVPIQKDFSRRIAVKFHFNQSKASLYVNSEFMHKQLNYETLIREFNHALTAK